ncbi:hypothetical protein Hypma_004474 [Hypsizygus marmoreus]|uniref:F-box domain-containing protein n=1 Tax=Hypsizygus marmoreus TaxID=39966 RepID=A0A369K603_HYPMA|nr:hypothetical protein Hypma_004474 [Hypsizygus marmoreus]
MVEALPLELVLVVARFVALHEDVSILNLAKTCHTLYGPCQKLLFSHVFVGDPRTCELLLDALEFNLTLAAHIKELRISQEVPHYWVLNDEHLPKLLALITSVQHFSLDNAQEYSRVDDDDMDVDTLCYWGCLSEDNQDAFMRMFSLPSLRALTIKQLWEVPMDFFSTFGHLECLTLVNVDFLDEEGFDVAAIASRPASFRTLDISLDDECDQLNELIQYPGSYFAKISSLIVRTYTGSTDSVIEGVTSRIMQAAAASIRHVNWIEERDEPFISHYDIPLNALSRLERFTFNFDIRVNPHMQEEQCYAWLSGLLEVLKTPSVVAHMRYLEIRINQVAYLDFKRRLGEFPGWRQLDSLLAARATQVEIILGTSDLAFARMGDMLWRQMLTARMPILNARRGIFARVAYKDDGKETYILEWS